MRTKRFELVASRCYLSGPEVEVAQRGQLDEVLGTGARHVSERQAQALEVAQRAAVQQQPRQVVVGGPTRKCQLLWTALLLLDFLKNM